MMWPGSDFAYHGKKCSFTMALNKKTMLEDRVEMVMEWLRNGANFVMFYIEEPDEQGHAWSPDSEEVLFPLPLFRIQSKCVFLFIISGI